MRAKLAGWLDVPTIGRGAPLDGFAAAAPLRSLPYLLDWTPRILPPPVALRAEAAAWPAIGWFSRGEPPPALAIERDPERLASCRLVVGDDAWSTHLAAALGVPTIILLPAAADWLWGVGLGPSPWYAALELVGDSDRATLAARLAV